MTTAKLNLPCPPCLPLDTDNPARAAAAMRTSHLRRGHA